MPVYLFTYHTYGSWLPDRPQGYVHRKEGILPPDEKMAKQYRQQMSQEAVLWNEAHQKFAIETLRSAVTFIDARLHAAATEPTHAHAIASWRSDRGQESISNSLKKALTIQLKKQFTDQRWLSENHSHEQVEDREHFDYLIEKYFPKHSGWKWDETRGYYKRADG